MYVNAEGTKMVKNSSRWIATNKSGFGGIYFTKPTRGENMWLEDSEFPVIQISKDEMQVYFGLTWEDEPIEIKTSKNN